MRTKGLYSKVGGTMPRATDGVPRINMAFLLWRWTYNE